MNKNLISLRYVLLSLLSELHPFSNFPDVSVYLFLRGKVRVLSWKKGREKINKIHMLFSGQKWLQGWDKLSSKSLSETQIFLAHFLFLLPKKLYSICFSWLGLNFHYYRFNHGSNECKKCVIWSRKIRYLVQLLSPSTDQRYGSFPPLSSLQGS